MSHLKFIHALQTFWQMEQIDDSVYSSACESLTMCFLELMTMPALLHATKQQGQIRFSFRGAVFCQHAFMFTQSWSQSWS